MIETIIKRDGRKEPFTPSKLNQWGEWAANTLGDYVDWPSVVLETVSGLNGECTSAALQDRLIRTCLDYDTWAYNRMAGRLYATIIRKDIYNGKMPTVKELHAKLQKLGYMEHLDYSDEEYEQVQEIIDHERDFTYAHYQIHTHLTKYAISDRVNDVFYETPQYIYMRMAMALAVDQPRERRMTDVAKFYEHLSMNRINAPTPNHVNLGTPLRGYASCCLYATDDTAKSIAIGNHIANTMTYMSAGIGAYMQMRSMNDPVRGGVIRHQGKLPYYRAIVGEVKANLQNGRGGACTTHFPIYDPEVDTLLRLKNPMSTEDKKIRGMDYSWGGNRFFARKVARNEDIFLFNCFTAPDLYDALYSDDEERFAELYAQYEADDNFKKTYVNARSILITAENEWNETGRVYEHNIFELNNHTPFNDKIFSSNLCQEIALPTKPYHDMMDLYSDSEDVEGEVATCNLAGICIDKIESEEQYEEVAYYALLMVDKCIHLAHYELPHIGVTSKARLNAGVGILGLAHAMAKNKTRYTSIEGKKFIHQAAERHYYYLVKASLRLGKELGNAPWMHKTKWPQGWLPLDTYNRNVDKIANFTNQYDWEALRQEIIANGGIRNSVLAAHMPTETSANASGTTNGLYPIRELTMIKTDNQRVNYWAAPNSDELGDWYESAWDIPAKDMTDTYAIVQKWTDQGISADFYRQLIGDAHIESAELIQDYLYRVRMGLKTKYYMNQKTSRGMQLVDDAPAATSFGGMDDDENCEACTL